MVHSEGNSNEIESEVKITYLLSDSNNKNHRHHHRRHYHVQEPLLRTSGTTIDPFETWRKPHKPLLCLQTILEQRCLPKYPFHSSVCQTFSKTTIPARNTRHSTPQSDTSSLLLPNPYRSCCFTVETGAMGVRSEESLKRQIK